MPKVLVLRGLPSSGKSTWAKKLVKDNMGKWIRVNKDDFRDMIHDGEYIKGVTEDQILMARDAVINRFLAKGINVIVDDTNFRAQHIKRIGKIAATFHADIEVKDFDVPLETCIERDKFRECSVGEKVIRDMYKQFGLKNGFPKIDLSDFYVEPDPYVPDTTKPKAIISDIDGTVATMNGRSPFDYSRVSEDLPSQAVIDVVATMGDAGHQVIFLSGRESSCRADTYDWLKYHTDNMHFILLMREEGDHRKDSIIKKELFDQYVRHNFNVTCVFDDRDQVVKLWRDELGMTCLQVAYGDF